MKYKLLLLVSFFVFNACIDTHKDIFVSEVTIEKLKEILIKQKCHNKAIFIFDPRCPTCMFYLRNEYPIMRNKFLDSIDYVFISVDTIDFEVYKKFFQTIGIKNGYLFSLQKKNIDNFHTNEKIISEAMQYLFANKENIYTIGFPISAMANKENKLKLTYCCIDDSTTVIMPQPWHYLCLSNLNEINFNIIDIFAD